MAQKMKERQSSMELLRLLLMLLIVALHLNYLGIGLPTAAESHFAPFCTFGRIWAEQVCACAVNAFVLLAGWFGLRWHWRRLGRNVLLRCVVYGLLIVFIASALQRTPPDWHFLARAVLPGGEYWFIVCYLGLWLLAPVLNAYVENTDGRSLWLAVAALLAFEWLYGWLYDAALLHGGYSIFSFVVLYLLARAMRLYPAPVMRRGAGFHIAVLIICSLLGALAVWAMLYYGGAGAAYGNSGAGYGSGGAVFALYAVKSYLCPLVIVESAAIVMAFAKMQFHSCVINVLGGSALAIYLIHAHPLVARPLLDWARSYYFCHLGAGAFAGLILMCLGICAVCLLIDLLLFRITRISR